MAGQRFGDDQLTAAGTTLGAAVLDVETASTSLGRILTAGGWATQEPYSFNPSYPSPGAVRVLAQASTDPAGQSRLSAASPHSARFWTAATFRPTGLRCDLGGQPLADTSSVVAAAAQAAVFAAAGDTPSVAAALVESDHLQQQDPTYYGGAWDALGRLLLTDSSLGGCRPLHG